MQCACCYQLIFPRLVCELTSAYTADYYNVTVFPGLGRLWKPHGNRFRQIGDTISAYKWLNGYCVQPIEMQDKGDRIDTYAWNTRPNANETSPIYMSTAMLSGQLARPIEEVSLHA